MTRPAWPLVSASERAIESAGVTITALLADGQISGSSGINSYSGAFTAHPDGSCSIGPLRMTRMGGPAPAMAAEAAFVALLAQVAAYDLTETRLTLVDAQGNELLAFAVAD